MSMGSHLKRTLLDMVRFPPPLRHSFVILEAAIASAILYKNLRVCKTFVATGLCHTGVDTVA